jgi:hypothetical protein
MAVATDQQVDKPSRKARRPLFGNQLRWAKQVIAETREQHHNA